MPRTVLLRAPRRAAAVMLAAGLAATLSVTSASGASAPRSAGAASPRAPYPFGIRNAHEPSGLQPPIAAAMPGYHRVFVDDFNERQLNWRDWFLFKGTPSGDPSGYFSPSHVSIGHGVLTISTYRDGSGGGWVSGGVGLWRVPLKYGAFFVRSRQTGLGPDNVDLLWPANNSWPPEIDFNETGGAVSESTWTIHYGWSNSQTYNENWHVDVDAWHTWGVIWTPHSIRFTLDGRQWGRTVTSPSQIPNLPMTLDMQQQSFCGITDACPTRPTSMLVDWVAVYSPGG